MRARARVIVGIDCVLTPSLRLRWLPSLRSGWSIQPGDAASAGIRRTRGNVFSATRATIREQGIVFDHHRSQPENGLEGDEMLGAVGHRQERPVRTHRARTVLQRSLDILLSFDPTSS